MQFNLMELPSAVLDQRANDAGRGAMPLDFTGVKGCHAGQVGGQCHTWGIQLSLLEILDRVK